jgi:sugar phosphate isomerase/epimerase
MAMLSVDEMTTFRWSFEEDVERYAASGIQAIGVWRHKLSDYGLPKAVELLREYGMKVSHLSWAGGFTGSDGRTHRESIDDAREAIQTAAALETKTLITYSGSPMRHTFNHARRLLIDALKQLVVDAEMQGVDLALEPMHPGCASDWTFLNTVDDALAVIDAVGSPRVKIVFDTYHLGFDSSLIQRINSLVDRIALVQLGDAGKPPKGEQNRCKLGEGVIPIKKIVDAFKISGYDGFYDVELLGEEIEFTEYQAVLEHSKQEFEKLVS